MEGTREGMSDGIELGRKLKEEEPYMSQPKVQKLKRSVKIKPIYLGVDEGLPEGKKLGVDVGCSENVGPIEGLAVSTKDEGDDGLPYEGDDGAEGAEGARF